MRIIILNRKKQEFKKEVGKQAAAVLPKVIKNSVNV